MPKCDGLKGYMSPIPLKSKGSVAIVTIIMVHDVLYKLSDNLKSYLVKLSLILWLLLYSKVGTLVS